jgi:glutamate N-acetyltransferase/amino-acid N-acetyltransferase
MSAMSTGVTYPAGFHAVAVEAAVKKPGRNDLALILSDRPAAAAAAFTTNRFAAAPVLHSRRIIEAGGPIRAIVVNAGNANAGTGERGIEDAAAMARFVAEGLGFAPDEILVSSTGVIGRPLPMDRVADGIRRAAALVPGMRDGEAAARAIMTTDTVEKIATRDCGQARIGGMAKGAGMIHPNMATMLAFLTTDAAIPRDALRAMLARAVEVSFNAISVDNDMSTNDTVFLLANGAAGEVDHVLFESTLTDLCRDLATKIVADGEGATKIVTIEIRGARSAADARLAADAVATSMLVKTALFGNDPNWGRILAAVGRSGADVDTGRVRVELAGSTLFENGMPTDVNPVTVSEAMKRREILIRVELGLGNFERTVYTTDLSREYVSINADYTT